MTCLLKQCCVAAGVMLGVCAALDLLLAERSSILGLAGFVTLPSREIVAIWQFAGIMVGSGELPSVLCSAHLLTSTSVCLHQRVRCVHHNRANIACVVSNGDRSSTPLSPLSVTVPVFCCSWWCLATGMRFRQRPVRHPVEPLGAVLGDCGA